jgi:diadenosine tetraphosphate (Ap4A) HIT family hydrolase
MSDNCIFCKIVKGEISCAKIWEDKEHLAMLDINPNTEGMTLVLTKEHYDSYAFDMPDDAYKKIMVASKKVARMLEKAFNISRVSLVMEGMGINHVHIKLYPMHGVKEKFKETWASEKEFFEKYPGYISTVLGPKQVSIDELKKLANEIIKKNKN